MIDRCRFVPILALLAASHAYAEDAARCPSALTRWAASCEAGEEPVRIESCPGGHAIFVIGPGQLRVDVTHRPEGAFVSTHELGLSPVGQFADWNAVPAADRAAFDALVRCARERPTPLEGSIAAIPAPRSSGDSAARGVTPLPWPLALGVLAALAVLFRRFGARGLAKRALPLFALGAATMIARVLLVPESYFHQNGHGPNWIAHALGEPGNYGPGYAQVFHWIASRAADPDGAVFFVQGLLGALVPCAAYAIARGAGAARAVAWAAAIGVALSPIGARLARGESYFATIGALLALAAAVVAVCTIGEPPKFTIRWSVLGAAAAGLFVAQAALVHPICWLAGALVPIPALVGPGDLRARLRLAALVTCIVALVVIVTAGLDLYAVLEGPLGAQWLGPARESDGRFIPPSVIIAVVLAIALVIAVIKPSRYRNGALALAALSITYAVAWRGNILGAAPPWVHDAYDALYLGPALAAAAALARELEALVAARTGEARARWLAAATVLGALALWHSTTVDTAFIVATDAREAALMRGWRRTLPEHAVVAYLERADRQIVALPLYVERERVRLFREESPADLTRVGRDVFLYQSGLCTTARGRAYCEALEAAYELAPVRRAVLPAIPSMEGLDYDRDEVEVVLYRVRDRRSASTTDEGSSEGREGR